MDENQNKDTIVLSPDATNLFNELMAQRQVIEAQIRALSIGAGAIGQFQVQPMPNGEVHLIPVVKEEETKTDDEDVTKMASN